MLEAAYHHAHLKRIANKILPLDPDAKILLLLSGKEISGPGDTPFAQKLDLGWVVVGDMCLGGAHRPLVLRNYKTAILENGRASHRQPCDNHIKVRDVFDQGPKEI